MTGQAQFRLDLDRCTGCSACVVACENENEVGEGLSWRNIRTFNEVRHPSAPVVHYSLACNHCQEPACMYGCPADAYRKDGETGAVLLDGEHCIGCRYCTWVCPYGAPQFNRFTRVMEKCTFCSHRLAEDLEPACVVACPVDALGFAARAEPSTLEAPGFPEVGIGPSLQIEGRRWRSGAPEILACGDASSLPLALPNRPGLSLREEWPLLVFTLISSLLVAWFSAFAFDPVLPWPRGFSILGVTSILMSTLHLGRPERAWRAILNVRRSWVSREILLISAFLGLTILHALLIPLPDWLLAVTAVLGFAALFAADKIYDVAGQISPAIPHSAMNSLTAAYLLGLLAWEPWIAIPAGGLKLLLYGVTLARRQTIAWHVGAVRILLGFIWPIGVLYAGSSASVALLIGGPLLGEVIDRVGFYQERRFLSPERQIDIDLHAMVTGDRP